MLNTFWMNDRGEQNNAAPPNKHSVNAIDDGTPWVPKCKGSDNEDSYEEWQGQIQFMIQNTNADSTTTAGVSNACIEKGCKKRIYLSCPLLTDIMCH